MQFYSMQCLRKRVMILSSGLLKMFPVPSHSCYDHRKAFLSPRILIILKSSSPEHTVITTLMTTCGGVAALAAAL